MGRVEAFTTISLSQSAAAARRKMSTDTITNQVPINNTIQVKVRPGDETGLYYILLSNLPWQTSWQQLKDHVRTVCPSVERVEIFNESTTGWVSVRGRENYEAALYLLTTKPFNGRPTFADGRNATQEIHIKRLVGIPEMLVASPRSPRTPRTTPPGLQFSISSSPMMSPTLDYHQWPTTAPISLISSPVVSYEPHSMPMPMPCDFTDTGTWQSYDNSYVDHSSTVTVAMHPYVCDTYHYPQQYNQPNEFHGSNYPTPSYSPVQESQLTSPGGQQGGSEGFVQTERRKIIIKGLSSSIREDQIKELVRSKCGFDPEKVYISIPPAEAGGNRGYATIMLRSEDWANKAIRKLHNYKLEGKTLKVDYTKEGVSRNEDGQKKGQSYAGHHSSKHHREDRGKQESSKQPSPNSDKKDKSSAKKGIVIANGSSKRASENIKKAR
ncbi:hypothetical protein BX600DRAFT_208971 [Xylariales sp. PMI_506]|nr:hypothetical protein BX600DRAFT_208971 [Xylariales sp. PMI_506]